MRQAVLKFRHCKNKAQKLTTHTVSLQQNLSNLWQMLIPILINHALKLTGKIPILLRMTKNAEAALCHFDFPG